MGLFSPITWFLVSGSFVLDLDLERRKTGGASCASGHSGRLLFDTAVRRVDRFKVKSGFSTKSRCILRKLNNLLTKEIVHVGMANCHSQNTKIRMPPSDIHKILG